MKNITIFTPTYNRAYCLDKLYNSLKNQTDKDFVWLIVDDGSSDDTESVVKSFIVENLIEISYHKKPNGGKHTAHNLGVELCETELFCCVDSDDYLTDNAIEVIKNRYLEVKDKNVLGLYLRRVFHNGKNMASNYPKGIKFIGISDLYFLHKFQGETVIVLKTDIVKNYFFPVFEDERFVSDNVLYNQLNGVAPMYLCEDGIYCCEYLDDGYTKNALKLIANNPKGAAVSKLSNAVYGKKLVDKTKAYSEYLSIIKVFNLDKKVFTEFKKPCFIIKVLARILNLHYYPLYKRIKEENVRS